MGVPAERLSERVVLVVDDEEPLRRYLARALGEAGFRVVQAYDGLEAITTLTTLGGTVIGLVVSDITMPRLSRLELAAVVDERWPTVPVLLISGNGGPPPGYPGPFLPKPFAPEALVAAVEDLLPPLPAPQETGRR
jgi:DNA-binding NtrC family response regulator